MPIDPDTRASAIADICERVSRGELVIDACAIHGIQRSTLFRWCEQDADASNSYARARVNQAHAIAEQALQIADGRDGESRTGVEAMLASIEGVPEADKSKILHSLRAEAVQRDRLRVDTRKWMASKIAPKLYGEKLDITSDGEKIQPAVLLLPPES